MNNDTTWITQVKAAPTDFMVTWVDCVTFRRLGKAGVRFRDSKKPEWIREQTRENKGVLFQLLQNFIHGFIILIFQFT